MRLNDTSFGTRTRFKYLLAIVSGDGSERGVLSGSQVVGGTPDDYSNTFPSDPVFSCPKGVLEKSIPIFNIVFLTALLSTSSFSVESYLLKQQG